MLEFFFEKKFGEVLDLYQLPIGRNFEYLEKNGVLQFFIRLAGPDDNAVHGQLLQAISSLEDRFGGILVVALCKLQNSKVLNRSNGGNKMACKQTGLWAIYPIK